MRISKSIISVLSVTLLSTSFIGVTNVHASTLATTPMLGNRYSKQTANYQDLSTSAYYIKATPKISKLKVTYSSKKHAVTIKGHVKGVKKLLLNYKGKKIANVKTKAGKFVITKRFKGYGTFKLLSGATVVKTITTNKYATKKPVVKKATRTKKGIHYTIIGNKNATTNIFKNGKYLMSITAWDTNQTKFYLNNSQIKNSSKNLTITQKITGKKTSPVVKLPTLHVSAEYNTIY